jgi:hypothetical protein
VSDDNDPGDDGPPPDLMNLEEAAALLPSPRGSKSGRLSVATLYRYMNSGKLPYWRMPGNFRLVSRADVLSLLEPVRVVKPGRERGEDRRTMNVVRRRRQEEAARVLDAAGM